MCLTVPAKVLDVRGSQAVVESRGWRREADVSFVRPEVGDYVLVQSGVILQILDEAEALEALSAWAEVEGSESA
jgi:hydrogenase assembly chaperone HypC/HupF